MSLVTVDDPEHQGGRLNPRSFLCVTCAAGLAAAFFLSAFPGIDLAVSGWFYLGEGVFLFDWPSLGAVIRLLLRIGFGLACVMAVAGFVSLAFFNRRLLGLGLAPWAYIALCAAIGPGLVTNLGFKDHWGRARPAEVTEFGGTKQFTPPMLRTDQCDKNCSFFSGEASNYFVLGFAFAFLFGGPRRREYLLAAIAAGSLAGFIRIGGGGHFLSDIVFAGIFMAFVACGLAWLILERWAPYLTDGGPLHQRLLRFGLKTAIASRRLWQSGQRRAGEWQRRRQRPPGADNRAA